MRILLARLIFIVQMPVLLAVLTPRVFRVYGDRVPMAYLDWLEKVLRKIGG